MKKNIFGCLSILLLCFLLVGCFNNDGSFTITCKAPKSKNGNITSETSLTYKFNKEQLATEYTVTTTQVFKDKKTYETYKKAQEETVKENKKTDTMKIDLKSYDKEKKLVFTYTLTDLDEKASNKESIKASTILKRNEDSKSKCTINGISKNKLK